MWLLMLLGCPAEMLGVELPAAGVAALSEADLQRDTRMLSEVSGDARLERLHRRYREMRLEPAFGRDWRRDGVSCGARDGEGGPTVLVVASDDGTSVEGGAIPAAALISLAKITDLAEHTGRSWLYCDVAPESVEALLAAPPRPVEQVLVIGPLGDGAYDKRAGGSVTRVTARTPKDGQTADGVDYRGLRGRVEAIWLTLLRG